MAVAGVIHLLTKLGKLYGFSEMLWHLAGPILVTRVGTLEED